MFKKIFYSLTILAMLFGMFGVMGKGGVQTASAADSIAPSDPRDGSVTLVAGLAGKNTYINTLIDWTTFNVAAATDPIDCGDPTGAGGESLWVRAPAAATITYLHVHAVTTLTPATAIAGVFPVGSNIALGCGINIGGLGVFDFQVTIPAGLAVDILYGNTAAGGAGATNQLYMNRTTNTGSLMIREANAGTGGFAVDDVVVAYNAATATQTAYTLVAADLTTAAGAGVAFLDLANGTYSVGVAEPNAGALSYVVLYPTIVVSGGRWLDISAIINADMNVDGNTTTFKNIAGAGVAVNAFVAPSDGSLGPAVALPLGTATAAGVKTFDISAGTWDVQMSTITGAGEVAGADDYFLVKTGQAFVAPGPLLLVFDNNLVPPAFVTMCSPAYLDFEYITLDPAGPLARQTFRYDNGAVAPPLNYECGNLYLTPTPFSYDATATSSGATNGAQLRRTTGVSGLDYRYFETPATNPWSFAAGIASAAYTPLFGAWFDTNGNGALGATESTFRSTASTSAEYYTFPVAAGQVAMTRGIWRDANSNTLMRVTAPDDNNTNCLTGAVIIDANNLLGADANRDIISPCDWLFRGIDPAGPSLLANDWLTANLSPVTAVGRYEHSRALQTRDEVIARPVRDDFMISVADASFGSSPFYNYISALYEAGITTGMTATSFGADLPITRGQLARFLGQSLVYSGMTLPAAPAAATFTDVPTTHVFFADVEWLNLLGITTGTSATVFGVNDYATRETMAVWAEKAGRAIAFNGGPTAPFPFYPELGTLGPDYLNANPPLGICWDAAAAPGGFVCNSVYFDALFSDVPSSNANALWIEEAAADGITVGISGIPGGIWMYGPALPITRGQMAAFIGRSVLDANPYFWGPMVFPSPMK